MERVLIVEDEADIRDVLVETLKRWGYDAVVAENGKVGLDKFRSQSFSLILTDIRMPVLDGLQMLKTMRKENQEIPIVVITGYPSVDSAVESLSEGADYYIVKPINFSDLKAKIGKSLEKRKTFEKILSLKRVNISLILLIPIWILLGYLIARVLPF